MPSSPSACATRRCGRRRRSPRRSAERMPRPTRPVGRVHPHARARCARATPPQRRCRTRGRSAVAAPGPRRRGAPAGTGCRCRSTVPAKAPPCATTVMPRSSCRSPRGQPGPAALRAGAAGDEHPRLLAGVRHVDPLELARQHVVHRERHVLDSPAREHDDLGCGMAAISPAISSSRVERPREPQQHEPRARESSGVERQRAHARRRGPIALGVGGERALARDEVLVHPDAASPGLGRAERQRAVASPITTSRLAEPARQRAPPRRGSAGPRHPPPRARAPRRRAGGAARRARMACVKGMPRLRTGHDPAQCTSQVRLLPSTPHAGN